jgi:exodeoxyribonuclease VII large subunit
MFRRAAGLMEFVPRDGEMVEVQGRLAVYEPRGDLQLIVETLSRAGPGALFEQFLQLKARLEAQGLFDPARKRPVPALPKGIGLVTSPGAAALHDVATALRRRARHVPVVLVPAAVQGSQAPAELVRALTSLYRLAEAGVVDVILLVRGGGSIEDLWAFNDEQLARTIIQSPVPLISGVGHETDFTIADFCADARAPTPTAAAELAATPRDTWLTGLASADERLRRAVARRLDSAGQRLDIAASRLGRPLVRLGDQRLRLSNSAHRLRYALLARLEKDKVRLQAMDSQLKQAVRGRLQRAAERIDRSRLRLELLDPRLVLERGYALLTNEAGQTVGSVRQTHTGQFLRATLADGEVDLTVAPPRLI